MNTDMTQLEEYLSKIAAKKAATDQEDFCALDFGQYDDCFSGGINDGKIELARELLKMFFDK